MITQNKFFVALHGDNIHVLQPIPVKLTPDEALNLAAWIVAVLLQKDEFDKLYAEITK
jgi:hypothetical protein